jgi:hypothetical protein
MDFRREHHVPKVLKIVLKEVEIAEDFQKIQKILKNV